MVNKLEETLYNKLEADSLTFSEKNELWRDDAEKLKADLIIKYSGEVNSLLDIGCAWGQTLNKLIDKIPILAGVDESPDRLKSLNSQRIKTYQCRSDSLILDDNSFEAILMSHILHEIKLFNELDVYANTMSEIKRVLKQNGNFIVIDHRDPGPGRVTIDIGSKIDFIKKFQDRFKLRHIEVSYYNNEVNLSIRDCHDFITKIWSIDTAAEELEMNETHTVINANEFTKDMIRFGLKPKVNISFNPISNLMSYYGIKIIDGNDWGRQLFILSKSTN